MTADYTRLNKKKQISFNAVSFCRKSNLCKLDVQDEKDNDGKCNDDADAQQSICAYPVDRLSSNMSLANNKRKKKTFSAWI